MQILAEIEENTRNDGVVLNIFSSQLTNSLLSNNETSENKTCTSVLPHGVQQADSSE